MPDFSEHLTLGDDGNWVFNDGELQAIISQEEMKRIFSYENMTEDELRSLAKDIFRGSIFTSDQCPSDMLGSVFMITVFLDDAVRAEWTLRDVTMLFEDVSKSAKMSVNGYPVFFSCRSINREEHVILRKLLDEMK